MILQAFIRGAIVIAIAALLSFMLRNRSAALRHHIWATALVVQLALLAFIPVLPKITLPIIPTITASVASDDADGAIGRLGDPAFMNRTETQDIVTQGNTAAESPNRPIAQSPDRPINWLLAIWLSGAAFIVLRYLIGTAVMMRIAHKGNRVDDGEWLVLAQRISRELDITRPVTMIWGDKLSVPITWGVLYPMILLPESAREWPAERRRFVLVHEMAHVKRFDALTQLLAQLAAAIFWFSPFVWIAEWRMRIEREHACDDTVIQHGTEPTLYADELLQMVRSLVRRRAQQPAFAALAMARKSEFEGRMIAILDPERRRAVTGISSGVVFALLSVLIAAPVAAIDPFAVNVVTVPQESANPRAAVAASGKSADCSFDATTMGTTVNTRSDSGFEVSLQRGDYCLYADVEGNVDISDDDRRVLAVPAGGRFVLRRTTREGETALRINTLEDGRYTRSFTVNGVTVDDDGNAERKWLARVLPEVMREGGIDPPERIARMLAQHGLIGTLAGISEIKSATAKRDHYIALIKASKWTDAEHGRIRAAAARNLDGADLNAVIGAMRPTRKDAPASKTPINSDAELMDKVMGGFTSSYDLRMAMVSQLPHADRATLLSFGKHARRMTSSFEISEFLLASKKEYLDKDDPDLAAEWFKTVPTMSSSYERSKVLAAAIPYLKGSEDRTLMWLRATSTMSSGFDKANVLAALAKAKLVNTPALRTALLEEVSTLSAGSDRRIVLEALK